MLKFKVGNPWKPEKRTLSEREFGQQATHGAEGKAVLKKFERRGGLLTKGGFPYTI
jgi:hypothetical protein